MKLETSGGTGGASGAPTTKPAHIRVGVSVIDLHVDCKCRKSAQARDIKNETPFTKLSQKTEE